MDLLFDLDGTLTNSAPGILRCFAHALDHVGRPGIDVPVHFAVGPPLYRVFEALLPGQDTALIELPSWPIGNDTKRSESCVTQGSSGHQRR